VGPASKMIGEAVKKTEGGASRNLYDVTAVRHYYLPINHLLHLATIICIRHSDFALLVTI